MSGSCEAELARERVLMESLEVAPQLSVTFEQEVLTRAAALRPLQPRSQISRLFASPSAVSLMAMILSFLLFFPLYAAFQAFSWGELARSLFSLKPLLVVVALWLTFFVVYVNERHLEKLLHSHLPEQMPRHT